MFPSVGIGVKRGLGFIVRICVDRVPGSVSYPRMIRLILLVCAFVLCGLSASFAQKSNGASAAASSMSADQARTALDVLNDPAKRAAVAATLNAIIKTQPAKRDAAGGHPREGPPRRRTAEPAKPSPTETTVEGVTIPLAPDSLGAQILLSASAFVNNVGNQAMDALDTVQSLPLLYGWIVVMATNPIARSLLTDVAWRIALVLACAAAVEYGLRRAMQSPIRSLEALAPAHRHAEPEAAAGSDRTGTSEPDQQCRIKGRIWRAGCCRV